MDDAAEIARLRAELAAMRSVVTEACASLDEAGDAIWRTHHSLEYADWTGNGDLGPTVIFLESNHKRIMANLRKADAALTASADAIRALIDAEQPAKSAVNLTGEAI